MMSDPPPSWVFFNSLLGQAYRAPSASGLWSGLCLHHLLLPFSSLIIIFESLKTEALSYVNACVVYQSETEGNKRVLMSGS